jgi:hypothetical protein
MEETLVDEFFRAPQQPINTHEEWLLRLCAQLMEREAQAVSVLEAQGGGGGGGNVPAPPPHGRRGRRGGGRGARGGGSPPATDSAPCATPSSSGTAASTDPCTVMDTTS